MTEPLAILVPVLHRPHRVAPLLRSIAVATPDPYRVVFICDGHDEEEQAEVTRYVKPNSGVGMLVVTGNYSKKINRAVRLTDAPLIFTGADDLWPMPGWLEAAEKHIAAGAHVVGVNDLIPRRRLHATHFLITREYAERGTFDGGPGIFHEGYHHWFVDDELVATAKARGVYAYAEDAVVEHRHPQAGKADDDPTYILGRSRAHLDRRLFRQRSRLWAA